MIIRMHDLQVRQVVPEVRVAGALVRRFDSIECITCCRIPERMEVHLEPLGGQCRDDIGHDVGFDHRYAARAAFDEVGLEHRGRVILHDTVDEDLDARGADIAPRISLAQFEHARNLLLGARVVPEQRGDDAHSELGLFVEVLVSLEVGFVGIGFLQ